MNNKIKFAIGVIVFALLIGGAYTAYNELSKNRSSNKVQLSEETKETPKKEAALAPDFTVTDKNGNKVRLSDFFGKPIVLNFWASWCPPCKAEMPEFNKVYNEVKDDVLFIMVDMVDGQRETTAKGKKFISDSGYAFPVYFDETQQAAYTYRISSIPTTLFIDRAGNVVTGHQGAIDEKTLREGIEKIKQ